MCNASRTQTLTFEPRLHIAKGFALFQTQIEGAIVDARQSDAHLSRHCWCKVVRIESPQHRVPLCCPVSLAAVTFRLVNAENSRPTLDRLARASKQLNQLLQSVRRVKLPQRSFIPRGPCAVALQPRAVFAGLNPAAFQSATYRLAFVTAFAAAKPDYAAVFAKIDCGYDF